MGSERIKLNLDCSEDRQRGTPCHKCVVSAKDAEIERLKADALGERLRSAAINEDLDVLGSQYARLEAENATLKAQLAASEEKRKVLGAECRAWREFDGELAYSDSLQASQMMTTEDEKNVRAARNAARVAEKNTDKAASLEGESDGR